MAVSKARLAKWTLAWKQSREGGVDPLQAGVDRLNKWKKDPLALSHLSYWLKLEVWGEEEGLLVLAGVEPGTVITDNQTFASSFAAGTVWTIAQPFLQLPSFSEFPEPHDLTVDSFNGDADQFDAYLERREHLHEILAPLRALSMSLQHKLEHSPSALGTPVASGQWRPVAFLAWARSIGFKPHWHEWAEKNNLLPDQLDVMAAPFFDADSDSYPELLHIAVRAWESAKADGTGTPKQRLERFL